MLVRIVSSPCVPAAIDAVVQYDHVRLQDFFCTLTIDWAAKFHLQKIARIKETAEKYSLLHSRADLVKQNCDVDIVSSDVFLSRTGPELEETTGVTWKLTLSG